MTVVVTIIIVKHKQHVEHTFLIFPLCLLWFPMTKISHIFLFLRHASQISASAAEMFADVLQCTLHALSFWPETISFVQHPATR